MRGINECRRARQFAGDFLIGLAVFLAVLALAFSEQHSALSAPAFHINRAATAQSSPANVTSGTLFIVDDRDGASVPLHRARHVVSFVDIVVTGPIARFSVTQTFSNKDGAAGRGHFAFPLPSDAVIDTFTVQTSGRVINGKLVNNAVADRLFANTKSVGRPTPKPIQDYAGATSIDIHRIDANADVTIRFTYSQVLQSNAGSASFSFPLLGLSPPDEAHRVRSASLNGQQDTHSMTRPRANVSLRVRLDAGFPLNTVRSNSHDISVRKSADGTAVLNLSHARIATDRNFQLGWQVQKSAKPRLAVFKEANDKSSHLVAMLSAPELKRNSRNPAREVIFTVDTSGSMSGASLALLKSSLQSALSKLTPRDRFNVISFNSGSDSLFREAQRLTPESLSEALSFVAGLEARGGTEALSALNTALTDNHPEDTRRVRQIIFLTDGEIAGASEFLTHIAEKRGRSRLFMVGIGSDISEAVMRRAAEIGRGKFVHVNSRSDVGTQLTALAKELQRPVITDLHIEWPTGVRADASPNPLPDIYADETLLFSGELSSIKGDIKITGSLEGQPWRKTYSLANAATGVGISKLWTRHKIAALEARRYAGQSQSDVDAAIEMIALKHGVPSRRTKLVGVNMLPERSKDHALSSEDLPVILASAWVNDGISRPPVPDMTNDRNRPSANVADEADRSLVTSAMPSLELDMKNDSGIKVAGLNKSIRPMLIGAKPQAGGAGTLNWTLAIMAIVFATMTALTLGLWRHLRQAVKPQRSGKWTSRTR